MEYKRLTTREGDGVYAHEFKYCPNCGAKVVEE